MRVLEFSDPHHFLERAREFLFRDEVRHNLLLSSVLTLAKGLRGASSGDRPGARPGSPIFLVTEEPGGAALRSPNHRWIVDADTTDSASALATEISNRETKLSSPLRSVMLPQELAPAFSDNFHMSFNIGFHARTAQHLMSLTKLNCIEPSAGLLRFAQKRDLKLLTKWSQAFAEEGGLDESPQEAEEVIQKYVDTKQLFVWDNGRRLVAMAAVGGFTPRATRVSMVYTDPQERGKNYASTLVHRVSHKVLQEGKICVLFADAANPKTTFIYENLGYRTAARFTELKARPSDARPQQLARARPDPASR